MLPILIMTDTVPELDDEIPLDARMTELFEIQELRQAMPQAEKRARVPLGPWVEIRLPILPVTKNSDAAPASLQDYDQLLKLLLRRKADSLGRRQGKEFRRVMQMTGIDRDVEAGDDDVAVVADELARNKHASSARLSSTACTDAGRSMVDQHADDIVLWPSSSASAGVRGLRRAAVPILMASGDTQTRLDRGFA